LDIEAPGLQIPADPTRLAQVLDNLLSNAMKYAPGSPVCVTLGKEDQVAHITVKDNGPGIPPEHIKHLFERFYRVPSSNITIRGTGLGLFIVRRIVEAHGGEIKVESVVGRGTAFHIYLPLERNTVEDTISLRESTS
jgi:signal transduction histidine kinase